MAKNKTVETVASVTDFLDNVTDETRRKDCFALIEILKNLTQLEPKMWGPAIVGFDSYHYKYESGREGDAPLVAFSPRSSSIALYMSASFEDRDALLSKFGKYKGEKGCIHIKKLADIDVDVLKTMFKNHLVHARKLYPERSHDS